MALKEIAEAALAAAKAAGAEAADVLVARSEGVSMAVRGGALEEAEREESVEVGIRALVGQRQATVSASDIRASTLTTLAERAVAMAREAPEDPFCGLAPEAALATVRDLAALDLVDPAPPPSPDALAAMAAAGEAAALALPGVTQVSDAGASLGRTAVCLLASNGFAAEADTTRHSLGIVAIAGEGTGMERDYCFETRVHRADLPSAEAIGREAGARAVAAHGATRPPTGAFPVVFDERVAGSLVGHILAAINGAAVARGQSWLKDALGSEVLPAGLDLIEDPTRPRIARSRPFDMEGLATARRALIQDGVLQSFVLDLATARKLGLESTANAARGPGSAPSPSAGNVSLSQGTTDRAGLLREMGEGLLITGLIGATINPNTGDYSRGANGFWVKGGEIQGPVNECTIAGSLPEMLKTLRPANDARPHLSRPVPSLLVEGLTIAGG